MNWLLKNIVDHHISINTQQQKQLALSDRTGDHNKVLSSNLKFIYRICDQKFSGNIEDTFQDAVIGFLRALSRYNNTDTSVMGYCFWGIKTNVTHNVFYDALSYPKNFPTDKYMVDHVCNRFFVENGRYPTQEEKKRITGLSGSVIRSTEVRDVVCIDDVKVGNSGECSFDKEHDKGVLWDNLQYILDKLTKVKERDKEIFINYYQNDYITEQELSQIYGISRQRVNVILRRVLKNVQESKYVYLLEGVL